MFSIRSHSGNTASQVAVSMGYAECANYIERAAQIQEQATHVYDEMRTPVTHPAQNGLSPISNPLNHDRVTPEGAPVAHNHFISNNTYHSHPHLPANAQSLSNPIEQNGFNLNNNCINMSQSDSCDMEMEESNGNVGESMPLHANGSPGDVLLNAGMSQNLVPLAGKKRCWEDLEEPSFKRARNHGITFPCLPMCKLPKLYAQHSALCFTVSITGYFALY